MKPAGCGRGPRQLIGDEAVMEGIEGGQELGGALGRSVAADHQDGSWGRLRGDPGLQAGEESDPCGAG